MKPNSGQANRRPESQQSENQEKITALLARYRKAAEGRSAWEAHWRECYSYALPQRGDGLSSGQAADGDIGGGKRTSHIFDGTAPDGVDQLAASLLAQLTPPWSRWFGLTPGTDFNSGSGLNDAAPNDGQDERPDQRLDQRAKLAATLEDVAATVQSHFDHSNFAVEMHQCYLDLVTAGTACLLVEEAPPGQASAFRFTAVPLFDVMLQEGESGRLDGTFRRSDLTLSGLGARFPDATLPAEIIKQGSKEPDERFTVIEAVFPDGAAFSYCAVLDPGQTNINSEAMLLAEGRFGGSPFINFRWLKAPGESYGRSPVMKTLPDIKTVNKVVELILKNASIAVTGIWQAEDDGVLNPANIRLAPGAIIPKAVGSAGLTPLQAPGRFDVSQLVLDDLRGRIRHALLVDQLGQVNSPRMTATEVLQRAGEMNRLLGAIFGRLQSELLTPLIARALTILSRRGEIPPITLDGKTVELQYHSPLARLQAQAEVQIVQIWAESAAAMGPEAQAAVDFEALARWSAEALGVPSQLVRQPEPERKLSNDRLVDGGLSLEEGNV